jgi:ribonuclease BN (tRNA processing enzyme)
VVPTLGFVVEDDDAAVVFSSDTGPTVELWDRANALPHLKAVFLECSFPNALAHVADSAKHLTPALFERELQKLKRPATVVAIHIKPRFFGEVSSELAGIELREVQVALHGQSYEI